MGLEKQFLKMMGSILTIEPFWTQDRWNQPTYGPAVQVNCWFNPWPRRQDDMRADVNAEIANVTVDGAEQVVGVGGILRPISQMDRFTLPDGVVVPLEMMRVQYDTDGSISHYEMFFTWARK